MVALLHFCGGLFAQPMWIIIPMVHFHAYEALPCTTVLIILHYCGGKFAKPLWTITTALRCHAFVVLPLYFIGQLFGSSIWAFSHEFKRCLCTVKTSTKPSIKRNETK